jgi:hypothetical protein
MCLLPRHVHSDSVCVTALDTEGPQHEQEGHCERIGDQVVGYGDVH